MARIQNELFDVGADLSVPFAEGDGKLRIDQAAVDRLERDCDDANARSARAEELRPAGRERKRGRALHIARAVCRRAERDGARGAPASGR